MKTVKTFLTLSPDGDPNKDLVGVEAHRNHLGVWIIDKVYYVRPDVSTFSHVSIGGAELGRIISFLDSQEALNEKNAETSRQEVEAFRAGAGVKSYSGYLDEKTMKITTWMGDVIADVKWLGNSFECPSFGGRSVRQNFRARGIDGRTYAGTYFVSSGNYVRMRAVKSA